MKHLRSKRGVTIEITALFMLIAVGLSVVIFTYTISMSAATSSYKKVIESKFAADEIAAAFRSGAYRNDGGAFDVAAYETAYGCEGLYSFSYRAGEDGSECLDVYEYSPLVDCLERFLADPIECYYNFDFSAIKDRYVCVSWDFWTNNNGSSVSSALVPVLEVYTGTVCKLKIYTERVYDENGQPVNSPNMPKNALYKPSAVTWQVGKLTETIDEEGNIRSSVIYEWESPADYTDDAIREFYSTCADGMVFLKICENAQGETVFLKYRYGLA